MSTSPAPIHTARLDLVAATLAHVDAELRGPSSLAALLGASVPASWPPGEYDRAALTFFRTQFLAAGPSLDGWLTWYAMTREGSGARALVAAAGYFGPPAEGVVEIGYSVAPEAQRRGHATEIVGALVARVFAMDAVHTVIAHTTDENVASTRVLLRCGFRRVGAGADAGTVRYERTRDVA